MRIPRAQRRHHAGSGKGVEREYTPEERAVVEYGATELDLTLEEALVRLGDATYDVYLNDMACWKNAPALV